MSFAPSAAAQAAATLAGSNQAALAAPLTALRDSIVAGNLAPAALIDAILSAIGFQIESNNALAANSTGSTSFGDVPGSSITFTAPIAKTYMVHCDFSAYFTTGSPPAVGLARLVVNGSAGPSMVLHAPLNTHYARHLMHAGACVAGANIIKVQWAVFAAGITMNTDSNDAANYIVSG